MMKNLKLTLLSLFILPAMALEPEKSMELTLEEQLDQAVDFFNYSQVKGPKKKSAPIPKLARPRDATPNTQDKVEFTDLEQKYFGETKEDSISTRASSIKKRSRD